MLLVALAMFGTCVMAKPGYPGYAIDYYVRIICFGLIIISYLKMLKDKKGYLKDILVNLVIICMKILEMRFDVNNKVKL